MKTLIIHDRFMFRGGAERLVLILAKAFLADILTEFWIDGETFERSEAPGKIYTLAKSDLNLDALRYFRAQFNFVFKTRKIIRDGGYDLIIFSGNNCLSASVHLKKVQKFLLYCHSPVRHVFDLFEKNKSEEKNILKRTIYYHIGAWGIRFVYWAGLSKFKVVIANSKNTAKRLKKYCHKDSVVVWPPIVTSKFKWIDQKDYYLSFGRVDKLKRVGDIVRAFAKMPDKKLIVSSSGDDLENVKELAKGHDNIQVLGWVSDEELNELVGNCIASLYVPVDEDAGMVQLEANAAGKPCICNKDGGFLETIEEDVNGKFVPKDYVIEDICNVVGQLDNEKALSMRDNCERVAQRYSDDNFISGIKKVVEGLGRGRVIGIDASRSVESIQKTGVENVSDGLLKEMVKVDNVVLYTPKEIAFLPENKQKILRWPFRYLWTLKRLSLEMLLHKPDIYFSPVYMLPFFVPKKTYRIIHDVAFLKKPEVYSLTQRMWLKMDLKRSLIKCEKIFVPSESVKKDVLEYCNYDESKIVVIRHGYTRKCNSLGEKKKQIMYIGRVEEKKNILNLLKAFEKFRKNNSEWKLVLAGKVSDDFKKDNMQEGVGFLGYVSEQKKTQLLSESRVLALVSKEEGFGVPVLEALDFGLGLLLSDIPVLRELAGDFAYYANPDNVESMSRAMGKSIDMDMREKGYERLKVFSWEKAVKKYLEEIK